MCEPRLDRTGKIAEADGTRADDARHSVHTSISVPKYRSTVVVRTGDEAGRGEATCVIVLHVRIEGYTIT